MRIKRILSKEEAVEQVTSLINLHNRWRTRFSPRGISNSSTTYIVESYEDIVIGAVGIQKRNDIWTEIKHLVVRPELRRQGLGKSLVEKAIEEVDTNYVYASIRNDNIPSLRTFLNVGFFPYSRKKKSGYDLITMVRYKDNITNQKFLRSLEQQNEQANSPT